MRSVHDFYYKDNILNKIYKLVSIIIICAHYIKINISNYYTIMLDICITNAINTLTNTIICYSIDNLYINKYFSQSRTE